LLAGNQRQRRKELTSFCLYNQTVAKGVAPRLQKLNFSLHQNNIVPDTGLQGPP
jgi:hypothetical protein